MNDEQRRNLIREPLATHDAQKAQFSALAKQQYPSMGMETMSVIYTGGGQWIARGVEHTSTLHRAFVVRGDMARTEPCTLRIEVTPESRLWGMVYIGDSPIPPDYDPLATLRAALRIDQHKTAQFMAEVKQRYSGVALAPGSVCLLSDAIVAKGMERSASYVLACDLDMTCIMRSQVTELYKAWCSTYVQLDELPNAERLRNYRNGSWRP